MFLQVSFGYWTDAAVETLRVHENVRWLSVVWDKPVRKRSKRAYNAYV